MRGGRDSTTQPVPSILRFWRGALLCREVSYERLSPFRVRPVHRNKMWRRGQSNVRINAVYFVLLAETPRFFTAVHRGGPPMLCEQGQFFCPDPGMTCASFFEILWMQGGSFWCVCPGPPLVRFLLLFCFMCPCGSQDDGSFPVFWCSFVSSPHARENRSSSKRRPLGFCLWGPAPYFPGIL